MVVFFSSLENHLLSLKLLIFNYFLRVKEDAWQICVEHFTVIWWWSSRSQRVNAVQLQLWGIVIFVRFLSFLLTVFFFWFCGILVACIIYYSYSGNLIVHFFSLYVGLHIWVHVRLPRFIYLCSKRLFCTLILRYHQFIHAGHWCGWFIN